MLVNRIGLSSRSTKLFCSVALSLSSKRRLFSLLSLHSPGSFREAAEAAKCSPRTISSPTPSAERSSGEVQVARWIPLVTERTGISPSSRRGQTGCSSLRVASPCRRLTLLQREANSSARWVMLNSPCCSSAFPSSKKRSQGSPTQSAASEK